MKTHQGIAVLPVLAIIGAVLALVGAWFLFQSTSDSTKRMEQTNTSINRNVAVNTNTSLNVNTAVNTNVVANTNTALNANTNTAVDVTKDWQTYEDKKYDFSVKYPQTWSTKLYTTGYNNEGSYVVVFTPRNPPGPLPFISVRENWTVKQEVDRINTRDPEFTRVTSQQERVVNGVTGTEIIYSTAIGSTPKSFMVVRGSTTLIFNAVPNQTDWEVVIGTLVFTATADPTVGWKTYTNTRHNFSFLYPASGRIVQEDLDNLRIQNYTADVDNYKLKDGEFYLELFIGDNASSNYIRGCKDVVIEGVTTIFGSKSGLLGTDKPGPYGPNVLACIASTSFDYKLKVTEGTGSSTILGKTILSTLTFTK